MGIDVYIVDERGEIVEGIGDEEEIVINLLPHWDDKSYSSLKRVDPYGDAKFTIKQIPDFLEEWERASQQKTLSTEELKMSEQIRNLAQTCLNLPRHCLKFIGD